MRTRAVVFIRQKQIDTQTSACAFTLDQFLEGLDTENANEDVSGEFVAWWTM